MANIYSPDVEGNPGFSSKGFPAELHAELAEAFPHYQPSADELEAEFQREVESCRQAAVAAGIAWGFRYRTRESLASNGTYEGFAESPSGEKVYTGQRVSDVLEADDAAILLAGRLAARQATAATTSQDDGDDDRTPPAGAIFPEVATWPDTDLVSAIELADHRHPALTQHEQLLHECSAEFVRRLESSGVGFAA